METYENMLTRRSIRKFKSDPVEQEKLDKIINAGLYAPSGMGRQSTVIIQITDKKVRDEISRLNAKICQNENIDPFYNAPAILVVLAKKDVPTRAYDGSLVMQN